MVARDTHACEVLGGRKRRRAGPAEDHPYLRRLFATDLQRVQQRSGCDDRGAVLVVVEHPNQVNNVLGFPFLFRGALDVRARAINPEMMIAATKALAELAKASVPMMASSLTSATT